MATHDPTISEIADETLIMSDGRMSREIPEELKGTGIFDAVHLPGTLHGEIGLAVAADRAGLHDRIGRGGGGAAPSPTEDSPPPPGEITLPPLPGE
jgi:hypothetical protein